MNDIYNLLRTEDELLEEEELILMINDLKGAEEELRAREQIKRKQRQEFLAKALFVILQTEYESSKKLIIDVMEQEAAGHLNQRELLRALERRLRKEGVNDDEIIKASLKPSKGARAHSKWTETTIKAEKTRLYNLEYKTHQMISDEITKEGVIYDRYVYGHPSFKRGQKEAEKLSDKIMKDRWAGDKNISERIWSNLDKLEEDVSRIVRDYVSGEDYLIEDAAEYLAERFEVAEYKAERLVRTEMNNFSNQTEIRGLKEDGVEYYKYIAIQDDRTSNICNSLAGKVFRVDEAETGVNLPPLHPNCRSTIIPFFRNKED